MTMSETPRPRTIAWIVPVLDDGAAARGVIERARRDPDGPDELVVIDATDPPIPFQSPSGSRAGSARETSRNPSADLRLQFLTETPGLARQLNRGAAAATSDWLLFHYADVRLPDGWRAAVQDVARQGAVGGAFRLDLGPRFRYRAVALAVRWRERWAGLGPFGDQGIFCCRSDFEAVGGFDESVLVEDLDLVRRLRVRGRFAAIPQRIEASPRRWESEGFVRTAVKNCSFLLRHLVGDRSARARDRYREHRRTGRGVSRNA